MNRSTRNLLVCLQAATLLVMSGWSVAGLDTRSPVRPPDAIVIAQADWADKKRQFWEQWAGLMKAGKVSEAQAMVRGSRRLAEQVANEVGNHGVATFKQGDHAEALGIFQVLLSLYAQLEDAEGMAVTELNIGHAYLATGDCKKGMHAFSRSEERYLSIGNRTGAQKAADGLGACVWKVSVPDDSLESIANLKVGPDGRQIIVLHPVACLQLGTDICEFYALHEYAHVVLGHAAANKPWEEGEIEADCWAAKYGRRASAMAAYDWFLKTPSNISPQSHTSNELRAERIRACGSF